MSANITFAWRYLRTQRLRFAALVVVIGVTTTLAIVAPLLVRAYIDDLTASPAHGLVTAMVLVGAYAAIRIGSESMLIVETALATSVAWRSTNALRRDLFRHIIRLPISFHHRVSAGELVERTDGDVSVLSNFFSRFMIQVIGKGAFLIGIVVALFLIDWRVGVVFAGFGVLAIFSLRGIALIGQREFGRLRGRRGKLTGRIEEWLTGLEDIRGVGARGWVWGELEAQLKSNYRQEIRAVVLGSQVPWAAASLLVALATATALVCIAWLSGSGAITLGTAFVIFTYTQQMMDPLRDLTHQFQDYQLAAAALHRARGILDEEREPTGDLSLGPAESEAVPKLQFEHVSFGYGSGAPVLRDANIVVMRGRSVAIVGRTGAGKSTIARLVLALHRPEGGRVLLDGQDLATLRVEEVRRRIALVSQEVQLLDASVRENMAMFGKVAVGQIEKLVQQFELDEFVRALPSGLDTKLGPGDHQLSAGQAQLVALMRAVIRDPDVLILDEASARLDPITDAQLHRAIVKAQRGRTTMIIAHRLSTVLGSDDTIVLDAGEVVEQGPTAALLGDANSRLAGMVAVEEEGLQ